MNIDEEREYKRELSERQRKHREAIAKNKLNKFKPCIHDQCPNCHGTGLKVDGSMCNHFLSCNCPKCGVSSIMTFDIKIQ